MNDQRAQNRIQYRQAAIFFKADKDYGSRVAQGLGLDAKEAELLAGLSPEDRAKPLSKELMFNIAPTLGIRYFKHMSKS